MLHLMSRRSFLLATVGGFALLALLGANRSRETRGDLLVCRRCEERVAADRIAEQVSFVRHSAALRSDRELRCQTQNGGIPIRGRYRARP